MAGAAGGSGIVGYGAYVPYHRMERRIIADALGAPAGPGQRAVASFDEDTTSMGVEAGRAALHAAPDGWVPDLLLFATTAPAYLDKTNATAIQAALRLPPSTVAVDLVGGARNGVTALGLAAGRAGRSLVVSSDLRVGRPASLDEREGGDAAVAIAFGPVEGSDVLARLVGRGTAGGEFHERSRLPGEDTSRLWEERFGEHAYTPLVDAAIADAVKESGIAADAIDHLVVVGPHRRAVGAATRRIGASRERVVADLVDLIGNTGAAHGALLLADTLDRANPGEIIAVVSVTDGVDVLLLETTPALLRHHEAQAIPVAQQVTSGVADLDYLTFLTWRGMVDRQPPRRPDPRRPASPPAHRSADWKFGFVGSRCDVCDTRHLPPQRVCVDCAAVDAMSPEPMADVPGRIATFTVDRLTYSVNPPVVAAVIDFDGGGRFKCELTDVDPDRVAIGDPVTMTFRRLFTADGVHNYFWKARPPRSTGPTN